MVRGLRQSIGWSSLTPVIVMVALALVGVAVWHYLVRPDPLPGAEVQTLLADHTARGMWANGRGYIIFFGGDGVALYGEADRETLSGSWAVDAAGEVCASFGGEDPYCYAMAREAGELVWILPGSNRTYPFTLTPGRDPAL